MNKYEHATRQATFSDASCWPIFITFILGLLAIGFFLLVFSSVRDNHREWGKYDYDFFTALSGNEKGLRYEKLNALLSARAVREIPKERLAQDLDIIHGLAMGRRQLHGIVSAKEHVRKQLIFGSISDSLKLDTLKVDLVALDAYTIKVDVDKYFRYPFDDVKRFEAVKSILLEGGPVPEIQAIERSLLPQRDFWWMSLLSIQFASFTIYVISVASVHGYYYPLRGLPGGLGPKLALLITVPGNLPLMFLIFLFSFGSGMKRRAQEKQARKPAPIKAEKFSSQSSRDSLERLTRRVEERQGL
jgi:hypothetical protein